MNNNTKHFPLPDGALPPLPKPGEYGPHVCAIVQLYLAVLDDLPHQQAQVVLEHARICAQCAEEQRLMHKTTQSIAGLGASAPSPHVDQAVMAAIAAHSGQGNQQGRQTSGLLHTTRGQKRLRGSIKATFAVALAAVLLLTALTTTLHFLGSFPPSPQAFALPSNLSWSGYALYHTETKIDTKGARYRITCYDDLSTNLSHVETVMLGSFDVVAVGDTHAMLSLDMMHHVAQWGASQWSTDEAAFNLGQLRSDLATKRAVYLDEDNFHGQTVYRVRARNGLVLLLDMNYHPVNVLRGAVGQGTGEAMYDTLEFKPISQVSNNMWNMQVPPGFHMGTLPAHP